MSQSYTPRKAKSASQTYYWQNSSTPRLYL